MIGPLLTALALAAPSGPDGAAGDASYVDASVRFDGTLLDWAFVDVDGDGRDELGISVRTPRGGRELRLHRMTANSVTPEPFATIPVLGDIIAWTFADVRPELPGRELVFLTRQGAWSFDPSRTSYKGNIQKLCDIELLYDVPSPRALPYWNYVLRTDGGEQLLLPDRSGFKIFGPDPNAKEGAAPWHAVRSYRRAAGYTPPDPSDSERRRREAERENDKREARLSATVGDSFHPFVDGVGGRSLIEDDYRIQAPALVDIDGDGKRDMLLLDGKTLQVFIATASGIPAAPTRVESLPDYLEQGGRRAGGKTSKLPDRARPWEAAYRSGASVAIEGRGAPVWSAP